MQDSPSTSQSPIADDAELDRSTEKKKRTFLDLWENLVRLGLGETALRVGTGIGSLVLVLIVVWVMGDFYLKGSLNRQEAAQAAPLPTAEAGLEAPELLQSGYGAYQGGVTRLAQLHTLLPARPRFEMTTYTVQKGDTIFAIAEKFNLGPSTILWGNYNTLADDPHRLRPGQTLNILPVDGVLYEWHAGDGLNGVAKFFGVNPEDIINWPGNKLTAESLGDPAAPNIAVGTPLIIPGGHREFVTWSAPRITRQNPAVAAVLGPGFCGKVTDGPVGIGAFIWPTVEKWISGYDYSPATNHYGIDIAGQTGNAIYAVDNGVVVYAGWNDWGYGNVVVIDHGNGWQSLYAHLSAYSVSCGGYVYQGNLIGAMGSTGNSSGPHLHFELRSDQYNRVNPWDFLPH